ncbi:RtcB family protein [Eikenella sp. NML99-0057]|uniref:RtcB family protein n=1 Tax=Eikenella sp. NML99-0057 TaxID=1795834 RepID=UPI000AF0A358|nr:RtcB family protein [Eikenella sp. NML99-0057]
MGTQNPQIISENIVLIAGSNTWIEGNAIQQFQNTACLPQMRRVAGMPDLHAGRGYPVGAAFFSFGCFYPALIGNDIGCGMALWQTDLPAHKAKPAKLAKQLGSIDAPLDESWQERINEILPQHPFQVALGTIGGGNHFAELQTVDTVYRSERLPESFDTGCLQLLVHSGSRGLGQQVLRRHVEAHGHQGLPENSPEADKQVYSSYDIDTVYPQHRRHRLPLQMVRFLDGSKYCLPQCHNYYWPGYRHFQAPDLSPARCNCSQPAIAKYRHTPLLLVYYADPN